MKKNSKVENRRGLTIGIDVSDRSSCYCVLDGNGEISAEGKVRSTPEAFRQEFGGREPARVALEAGAHSRWVSAVVGGCGHEGVVAKPRGVEPVRGREKNNGPGRGPAPAA